MTKPRLLQLDRKIDGAPSMLVTAIVRDAIIGSIDLKLGRHVAYVRALFVRPEHRRKGIATLLLCRCYSLAREHGCESLVLSVWRNNTAAVAFYRRQNFFVITEGDPELELARPLK
jgi:ribosomal protein S18 acetylase RimI-like enzyme